MFEAETTEFLYNSASLFFRLIVDYEDILIENLAAPHVDVHWTSGEYPKKFEKIDQELIIEDPSMNDAVALDITMSLTRRRKV